MIWILTFRECRKIGQKTYRMVLKTKRSEKNKKSMLSLLDVFQPLCTTYSIELLKGMPHAKRRLFEDKKRLFDIILHF